MRTKPLFIAITNQKGGVGKSTFTVVLASYLHYLKNKSVLVVDCDTPQYSLRGIRDREKQILNHVDAYKQMLVNQLDRTGGKLYPILTSPPDKVRRNAEAFLAQHPEPVDIVIVDMPGTVNSMGVLNTIVNMDYIIIPIKSDKLVMHSTLAFVASTNDFLASLADDGKKVPLKGLYVFWNKVDKRLSNEVKHLYEEIMERLGIQRMQTEIPRTIRYEKELSTKVKPFFRSTMFPPTSKLIPGSGIDELVEEICQIANL